MRVWRASLLGRLREEHFLERSKVVPADIFLATEIDGKRFGEQFHSIPDLDELILRIRRQGMMNGQGVSPVDWNAMSHLRNGGDRNAIQRLPDVH